MNRSIYYGGFPRRKVTSKVQRWNGRKLWFLFSTLFRLGCLIAFVYQIGTLHNLYFQYPTRTETSSVVVTETWIPALSMCKKKWGFTFEAYSRLLKVDKKSHLTTACGSQKDWRGMQWNPMCLYVVKEASDIFKDVLNLSYYVNSCEENSYCNEKEPMKFFANPFGVCYLFNSNFSKTMRYVPYTTKKEIYVFQMNNFTIRYNFNKIFVLAVHNGHELVNMQNIAPPNIMPGQSYEIIIKRITWNLLPLPYSTQCRDYVQEFLSKGRSGPSSRTLCMNSCFLEASINLTNCVDPFLTPPGWPFTEIDLQKKCKIIQRTEYSARLMWTKIFPECQSSCPPDCNYETFDMDLKPTKSQYRKWMKGGKIVVRFSSFEFQTVSLAPKYTRLELFSYVGGYMGIWLGVSFMSIIGTIKRSLEYLKKNHNWANVPIKRKYPKTKIQSIAKLKTVNSF